ncbi:MAG: hypothetical protein IKM09_04655, partial [Clostridia bacterium]|nr:hypothetical protein [Clostridia bacterium]
MQQTYDLIISDITLGPDSSDSEAVSEAKKRIKSIGLRAECTELSVYRCSVDARRKNNVRLVYSVLCTMRGAAPDKDTLSG